MKKDTKSKIYKFVFFPFTLLGLGGISLSLVTVNIYFGNEGGITIDKVDSSKTVIENSLTKWKNQVRVMDDDSVEEYRNSVCIEVECVSVWARDASGEYIPVSYTEIELNEEIQCILSNDVYRYYAEIEDDNFMLQNIVPGEYSISFEGLENYIVEEVSIELSDDSQIRKCVEAQYMDSSIYEEYHIAYEKYKDTEFMFMDKEGGKQIIEETFKTDAKGTFYFKVSWNLPHDVHIHLVNDLHAEILVEEKYNGGVFRE